MAEKKQRTVYRLTLVKSWNMEEADSYVELIEKGQPGNVHVVRMRTFTLLVDWEIVHLLWIQMLYQKNELLCDFVNFFIYPMRVSISFSSSSLFPSYTLTHITLLILSSIYPTHTPTLTSPSYSLALAHIRSHSSSSSSSSFSPYNIRFHWDQVSDVLRKVWCIFPYHGERSVASRVLPILRSHR